MVKIHEIKNGEGYNIITFSDVRELYGMLLCDNYVEFMKVDEKGEFKSITEEESPEEFNKLKDKYYEEILKNLE